MLLMSQPTSVPIPPDLAARYGYAPVRELWKMRMTTAGADLPDAGSAATELRTTARADGEKPTLIICKTIIGYGAPKKAGTASAHGEPVIAVGKGLERVRGDAVFLRELERGVAVAADLLRTHIRTYASIPGLSGMLVWNLRDFAVAPSFGGGSSE